MSYASQSLCLLGFFSRRNTGLLSQGFCCALEFAAYTPCLFSYTACPLGNCKCVCRARGSPVLSWPLCRSWGSRMHDRASGRQDGKIREKRKRSTLQSITSLDTGCGSLVPEGGIWFRPPRGVESCVVAQGPDAGRRGRRAESCSGSRGARRRGCGPGSRVEACRWVSEEAPLTGDGRSRNARLRTTSPAFSLSSVLGRHSKRPRTRGLVTSCWASAGWPGGCAACPGF